LSGSCCESYLDQKRAAEPSILLVLLNSPKLRYG